MMKSGIDIGEAMRVMANEFKYDSPLHPVSRIHRGHIPYPRRLAIFYLFNDILQYAARGNMIEYLEQGTAEFLPCVGDVLERLSSKEKSPFIRVLIIWGERHVLSLNYVEKLKCQWTQQSDTVPPQHDEPVAEQTRIGSVSTQKKLLHGDPKLVNHHEIMQRLLMQSKVSTDIADSISRLIPSTDSHLREVTTRDLEAPSIRAICGLNASLLAEVSVCLIHFSHLMSL